MFVIVHTTHKILSSLGRFQKLSKGVYDGVLGVTYLDQAKNVQAALKIPLSSIDKLSEVIHEFENVGNCGHLLVTNGGVVLEFSKGASTPNMRGFWHKVSKGEMLDGAVHYFDGANIFRVEG